MLRKYQRRVFKTTEQSCLLETSNNDEFTLEHTHLNGKRISYIRQIIADNTKCIKNIVLAPCQDILKYSMIGLTSMYIENQGIAKFDIESSCLPNLEVASFANNRLRQVPSFLYK